MARPVYLLQTPQIFKLSLLITWGQNCCVIGMGTHFKIEYQESIWWAAVVSAPNQIS